jgi:GNAT superfamily N-acetyltransferase
MAETTTTCPWKDGAYGLGTHTTKKGTKVTIRLATVEDVSEIRRLIVGLALYEKEPAETVEVTEDELRRDGFGAQPVFRCLLAEVESVAIGFALFFYNYSTWQGRCIYLEDLYVDESARGTGTGTLLLKTVAAIAHAEGWKLCGNQILRRVRAESSCRPPRRRRDACSMAWRCWFITTRTAASSPCTRHTG